MIHRIFLLARDWSKHITLTNIFPLKTGVYLRISPTWYHPIFKPYIHYDKSSFKTQFKMRESSTVVTEEGKYSKEDIPRLEH